METLILNNSSKKDVKLLVDIAKKLGMDLKVADRRNLIFAEALRLNQSVKKNTITVGEIVNECTTVRKRQFGYAKGYFQMTEDFDKPLDDFKEYRKQ